MRRSILVMSVVFLISASIGAKDPINLPYSPDGRIQYRQVVEVPGVPATELIKRARIWIAKNYRSAPDVTKGVEEDQIIVKGCFDVPQGGFLIGTWKIWHVLTLEAKEGKLRSTLDGFEVEWGAGTRVPIDSESCQKAQNEPKVGYRALFEGVDQESKAMLESLRVALTRQPETW